MNYFNYNGKVHPEGSQVIGADNHSFRYGDGLFETMKMVNGKLLHEDEHFARLWKGLKVLEFEIPKQFTTELLQREITALVTKNEHAAAARIRLTVVRGDGGLYDVKSHKPFYLLQSWSLPTNHNEWNSNGLVMGLYEAARKSCDILSNLKHNNYLVYVMAALAAKREKWNDAIVLNTSGNICDSTIANVFIVKENIIYTPTLKEGCVAGVTRKLLIQYLINAQYSVVESALTTSDLLTAEEVFLTNSIYHIRWVQRINDAIFTNTLTRQIFADFIQTI